MPRRREVPKREPAPDSKHGDQMLGRFINVIMRDGKKSTAENIVYGAFDEIENKMRSDPLAMFRRALDNIRPRLEVKSRRVGGANYQVPIEVRPSRRIALAFRWIIDAARKTTGKSMDKRLSDELVASINNEGTAIKKKEDTHRMAEANRAFAHLAWGRK